jgi:hypothetical protein
MNVYGTEEQGTQIQEFRRAGNTKSRDSDEQGTLNPGIQQIREHQIHGFRRAGNAKSMDSEEQGTLNPGIQKSGEH